MQDDMQQLDDAKRRSAAASQDAFWERRHDLARRWVDEHPAPLPDVDASHPIDAFIQAKAARA